MDAHRIAHEASRLLPLARRVLERYPFDVREVEHLATHSNVMFRVVTEDGRQMVLRIGSPGANTRKNIEYEVAWLAALQRDTDLEVVHPKKTGYGGLIVEAPDPDPESDALRPCVLFSWVPGVPLGDGAGDFGYRLLGRMCASLQKHGRSFTPPGVESMRRWDQVFYYEPDLAPVIIEDSRFDHVFSAGVRRTISDASDLSGEVLKETWSSGDPQVVHGDLHEWNAHVVGTRLYAFDFEDVMLATPAQDVSVCLYSSRAGSRAGSVISAFRRGYEELAAWPIQSKRQLDGLHAARQIMLMNYAAKSLPMGESGAYLDQVMPWLKGYVETYS
jgi:Ser/Thr protein kinase RdoA (MazF antagonist)